MPQTAYPNVLRNKIKQVIDDACEADDCTGHERFTHQGQTFKVFARYEDVNGKPVMTVRISER